MGMMATAIVTGNTVIALIVMGLATVGLLLLAREWLKERGPEVDSAAPPDVKPDQDYRPLADTADDGRATEPELTRDKPTLDPENFEPDVPYEDGAEDDYNTE